ncbi:sensor histidine kinase [Dongia rigui]|uniref:histidine kinase n=1 Tax=Dongia rigui TaxID=940149 RepID=A0ABU5DUE9_9PROT|nr:sensor histidine kinase [Dongia rigui]MDY0870944.1 sensor histidine kinase [Dongia rigui]
MIGSWLQPLRHRLILLFLIVLVVPSVFGIGAAVGNFKVQISAAHDATLRFSELASNYESNLLWQSQQIAQNLSRDEDVLAVLRGAQDTPTRGACDVAFARAVQPYPPYGAAVLFDLNGEALCQWDQSKRLINVSGRTWFKNVIATKSPSISGYLVSPILNEPIIAYGAPIFDVNGVLKGVVALAIRLNWLAAVGQEPGLPGMAEVTLLDHRGKVLVNSAGGENQSAHLPSPEDINRITTGGLRQFEATGGDGRRRIFAVNALGNSSLFVLLGIPRASVVDPLLNDLLVQIGILCLVSIAGMMAAILGARFLVTKWTEKLAAAADGMALGRLDTVSELRGAPIEIWQLGENLKSMAIRLEHREADLRESLAQKQLMLREIHHRVKNNLQIVTSLLNLYARLPRSEAFREAFGELQIRINALALVHRHLYESEDLKEIDLAPFMKNLCNMLQDGSGVAARRVSVQLEVPELRMSGDRAVPLALLTTEIVTNSFKHAFPDGRTGLIDIRLDVTADGDASLSIADNGIGPSATAPANPASTMGTTLIAAFAKQLGGKMTVAGPPGTTTVIHFHTLATNRPI